MNNIPEKFDFKKLINILTEKVEKVEAEYIFPNDIVLEGSALVAQKTNMAAIMVKKKFLKGNSVQGHLTNGGQPELPHVFSFIDVGGTTNGGENYNGSVRYTFIVDEEELKNEVDTQSKKTNVAPEKKGINILVKGGIVIASVGVGYGISKLLKKKPLIPMIAAPLVAIAGLIMIDQLIYKKP